MVYISKGLGKRKKQNPGDLNEIARNRAESRSPLLSDTGRKNFDEIDWTKKQKKEIA
jgi:hypothetical protein